MARTIYEGDKEGKGGKVASPCSACASPCGKAKGIKIDSRHGILAAALGSTLVFGFPVFCLVCPIGLTFATVLLVMRLFAFGDATWTVVASRSSSRWRSCCCRSGVSASAPWARCFRCSAG